MGQTPPPASRRRFGGARALRAGRDDGLAAVAGMLFSSGGGAAAPAAPAAQAPVPAAAAPGAAATIAAARASLPPRPAPRAAGGDLLAPAEIEPPQGLYVMVPAGIDTADRRRTALAVAASLAPRGGTAAVFLLEGGAADAHVFGEPASGRPEPGHCLDPADAGRAIRELLGRCDQVAVVPLETSRGVPGGLAGRARRTVFVAAADAESVVETYRELKAWRARGLALPASLLVIGTDGAAEAARLVRRLRRASREFLGCDLANQGFLGAEAAAFAAGQPGPPHPLARAPVGEIWPLLAIADRESPSAAVAGRELPSAAAAGRAGEAAATFAGAAAAAAEARPSDLPASPSLASKTRKTRDSHLVFGEAAQDRPYPRVSEAALPATAKAAEKIGDCPYFSDGRADGQAADAPAAGAPAAGAPAAGAPAAQAFSVFSLWRGHGREELVAAIEAQPAAMLERSLRQVIRVDVDEFDAPPLAAVRDDGALVAVLIAAGGAPVDTRAAARWLVVHRRLLALAYPCAGIREGVEPSAIVLAPLETPPADGLRRFLPIQLGGHRGIVLLP